MPGGIPVATMAIGKAGAKNAAYFASQILALNDSILKEKIVKERADNATKVADKDHKLQEKLAKFRD